MIIELILNSLIILISESSASDDNIIGATLITKATEKLLAIGCIMQACLSQSCTDLKPDIFHKTVNAVTRVLKELHLVSRISDSYLSDFSRSCFLDESFKICLNLRTERVIFNCSFEPIL